MSEQTLTGHALIRSYLKTLGNQPGVYRMLDEHGGVLYVGKARNLQARVSSYANPNGHSARIGRMIHATRSMIFLTVETETEALLLEQNLIKQLKPKYNVLLRDDKSFPHIMITSDHGFPQVVKHRGRKSSKREYFGPFASTASVNRTLDHLQKIFLLRDCSDGVFNTRTRPCLQYQIKRCSAPCVGRISKAEYTQLVDDARAFLKGRNSKIQKHLAEEMNKASEAMEFERAAALRDRIRALTEVQSSQGINPQTVNEADIIALHRDGDAVCIQIFFIRAHQNWGNRAYFPANTMDIPEGVILEQFIAQFYENKSPPKNLILSHQVENDDLLMNALAIKRGSQVSFLYPQRGEKKELLVGAMRNAREALARKLSETATQAKLLKGLADAFALETIPQRIEVYDNSHIQGAHAVGAMIVAGPEGYMKSSYRKFNIKSEELTPGDDFGMMKEVITRRFKALMKSDPKRESDAWPDLLLIDGGAGQISAVNEILSALGVTDLPFVGVAKGIDRNAGNEEFYRIGKPLMALRRGDPVLYFIQRLRDEAHRFAITTHRAKRSKAIGVTTLDDIPGVGATRKRALLARFGSAKAVRGASLKDLRGVEGISDQLAQAVYDFFQDGD